MWVWVLLLLSLASGQVVHLSPPPLTPGEAQALAGPAAWLADRLDFCACFAEPIEELGGAECIEFVADYAALWDRYLEDAVFQTCLGGCPCGLNTTECFDVFGCAPSACDGLTRPLYTGPAGTEGVGACAAGVEACLNGTTVVLAPEVTPSAEVCGNQTLDADCDLFPGCEDMDCFLDAACLNNTVEECFDTLNCNATYCDGLFRQCYTGPGGTLGVGVCSAGTETCVNGTRSGCVGEVLPTAEQCAPLLDYDCDGNTLNGFNLTTDSLNCGACGNECFNGTFCDGGDCVCTDSSLTNCGPAAGCVDTADDPANCGACGFNCTVGGSVCTNGTCACPEFEADCGGGVCQTLVDDANCGACGLSCNATLAGSSCVLSGSPVCECPSPLIACNGTCVDPTSDPDNCGACGVSIDDGNECTVDSCNGTVVNDAAAADGFNCTLGGGFGVCAGGNCTVPPGTVLSFSRTTTEESEVEPLITFTIETTFVNDPNANLTIWDLGFMPYAVGITPTREVGQYFDPAVVNATGDCTINPDWANFDYADTYYPPKEERLVTEPIALVTPGSGMGACTIVAVVSAENAFAQEQYGLCLPFLDNTTLTTGEAQFRIDNVSVATDSSSWTRCPYGGHHRVDVTGQEAGPLNVNIVTTFIHRRLANEALVIMDVTDALPLSGCAAVNASSMSCFVNAGATFVVNAGINDGDEGLWTGTVAQPDLPVDTRCTVTYNCLFSAAPSYSGTMPTFVASSPLDVDPLRFLDYTYAGELYEYIYEYGASNDVVANSTDIIVGPNCADGVQNQDETDVDCGGSACIPCEDGFACSVAGDCIGASCPAGTCVTP